MHVYQDNMSSELAAVAARLVVEDGLEYAAAKRRAVKQLGLHARTALPDRCGRTSDWLAPCSASPVSS